MLLINAVEFYSRVRSHLDLIIYIRFHFPSVKRKTRAELGMMAVVNLKNLDDYDQWQLTTRNEDYFLSRILPARATLRAVPLMADPITEEPNRDYSKLFSVVFRAGALALIAPFGENDDLERQHRAAMSAGGAGTNTRGAFETATSIGRGIGYAAENIYPRAFRYTEYAISARAGDEKEAWLPQHHEMWREISFDATALEDGETELALASRPLWSSQMPERIAKDWACVKQYLLELDQERWSPVIDWYEARLRGDELDTNLDRTKKILGREH